MRRSVQEMLRIVEKIDAARSDRQTQDAQFDPLWQHNFLREAFHKLLVALREGQDVEFHRHNFDIICNLMCPDFNQILDTIALDGGKSHVKLDSDAVSP